MTLLQGCAAVTADIGGKMYLLFYLFNYLDHFKNTVYKVPHNHSNTGKTKHKIYSDIFDSKHNAPCTKQRITQGNKQTCVGDQPKKVCLLLFVKKVDR